MDTVWLLDVDGVVNVLADERRENPRLTKRYARSLRTGREYLLCWRPRLLDDIRRATRFVEVQWATTWCDGGDVVPLEEALGLHLTPAFGDRPYNKTIDDLKVRAALDVLAAGHRLIWTDDTVVPIARELHAAFDQAVGDGRALLIAPDERRGITNRDMALIKAFARAGENTGRNLAREVAA